MIIEQDAVDTPAWSADDATAALRASALFGEATDAELASVAASCRIETVAAGTVVVREGDAADDAYLLLGGEFLVYSHDDLGRDLALERISQVHRLVAEQAFLSRHGARRTASVRAITVPRRGAAGAKGRSRARRVPDRHLRLSGVPHPGPAGRHASRWRWPGCWASRMTVDRRRSWQPPLFGRVYCGL